ncbi:MAG: hypothetical protein AB1765_02995 [Candidatus Hydrogenedentota bacterium]
MKDKIKKIILILCMGPLFGTIIHEAGHLLMIMFTDANIGSITISGKLQIYPEVTIKENMKAGFEIYVYFPDTITKGLVQVSGAFATLLVSIIGFILYLKKRRFIYLIFIFYVLDILTYITLPLIGLRRWLLFGPKFSEVIQGFYLLSINPFYLYLFLVIYLIISGIFIYRLNINKDSKKYNSL